MAEDRPLEVAKLRSRFEPKLLDKHLASVTVGLKRIGLTSRPIQSPHQLRVQLLTPHVLAYQPLELTDHLNVSIQLQVGFDPVLERYQLELLEAPYLRRGRAL